MNSLRFVGVATILVIAATASAWNMAGHMTTAAIAYDTLKQDNPQALAKIVAILKQHPQYDSLWGKRLEKVDAEDRDQAMFMMAARWADDIRNNPDYNRPPWHYIDYPYKPPGQPDSVTTEEPPTPNIEIAYRENIDILKKPDASAAEKAVALCWIMHLTGDSHQPLHSVSLFSTDYPAPQGDAGATKAFVRAKPDGEPINLHFFWDGLVIGTDDTRDVRKLAIELREKLPRDQLDPHPKDVAPADIAKWIQESLQLAKTDVYRDGKLATSPNRDNAPALPDDYAAKSKSVGERRATQSGYRMADVLVKIAAELSAGDAK
jgi:hypothetical protein